MQSEPIPFEGTQAALLYMWAQTSYSSVDPLTVSETSQTPSAASWPFLQTPCQQSDGAGCEAIHVVCRGMSWP